MALSPATIKSQFPIFKHHPDLVYLDNAATTHKPQAVIQTVTDFYEKENASVHRGLYELTTKATERYERVRKKVASFLGAENDRSIAFTKGTTESINIIAQSIERKLREGDNVVITIMEHHANLIPWQQICIKKKAELRTIPVDQNGELDLSKIDSFIDSKTRIVAITHISNTLGTINPIRQIIGQAHKHNAPVLIDAAQSVSCYPIDVKDLNTDFLVFSGHKMFGPMGVGVLYAEEKHWSEILPLNFGGGAIKNVELEETRFMDYPFNLEAGTPNVGGVFGLDTAIEFIQQLDIEECTAHIEKLGNTFRDKISTEQGFKVLGSPQKRSGIVSFYHDKIHPHDIASFLGSQNVAVRAGHHCTQPLLQAMGVPATVRASFSIYNSLSDVDKAMDSLKDLKKFWS